MQWWARDELRRVIDASLWNDARIATVVRDEIAHDPRIALSRPSIEVRSGVVTLRGVVPNAAAREAAVADALATVGVPRVLDELEARAEPPLDDETLAQRLRARLAASAWTAGSAITTRVEDAGITLEGTVRSRTQQREARRIATRLAGVRAVDDRLALDRGEPLEDYELDEAIRDGLAWSPFLDRMNVRVEVSEGTATLRGDVDDPRAYREAERETRDAGAVEVVNALTVGGHPVEGTPRAPAPAPTRR